MRIVGLNLKIQINFSQKSKILFSINDKIIMGEIHAKSVTGNRCAK